MPTATKTKQTRKSAPSRKRSIKTYDAAVRYLFTHTDYEQMRRVRYNSDTFSLDRMCELTGLMGDPQKKFRSVHIAGTKGKGSTAMMLATMLRACGLKVGLYTSPHIRDLRERIQINGTMITQAALTRLIGKIAPKLERILEKKPTFFEILTTLAFCHFADEKVDVAVVEAGMGGRLDSTNILTPALCGLTSISLDHTRQLGSTVGEIATEKAGIFKSDIPAISVQQDPEAKRVLKRVARDSSAELQFTGEDIEFSYRIESSRSEGCHTRICLTTPRSRFEHLPVPAWGEHQAMNCGLALALLDNLKGQGFAIDDALAVRGLADVRLPGRMEMINPDPRILLDGAHNAASVQALMRAIAHHIPYDSMIMIFGCAADKDIHGMMDQIATGADKVIFTRAVKSPRAAETDTLSEIYAEKTGRQAQIAEDLPEALRTAASAAGREDLICVCGSFYLVGEAKDFLAEITNGRRG
jgi:dihydrofolate synthase/folylpolyglutamate synthase